MELEFSLPSPRLTADALAPRCARHGYDGAARWASASSRATCSGFIDLVFEHEGRFYVLDWKSNHLGWHAGRLRPAPLRRAMDEHGYHLQYLLYTVALHRYLRQRLRGYGYDRTSAA